MSFIDEVSLDEAQGELKEVYDEIVGDSNGRLPAVLSVLSLNPKALKALRGWSNALSFGGSSLGRKTEEMIATYISRLNECHY